MIPHKFQSLIGLAFLSLAMHSFDFQSQDLSAKLSKVKAKIIRLSILRLVLFILILVFLVLGLAENALWLIIALIGGGAFVKILQNFNFQKDQEQLYLALEKLQRDRHFRISRELASLDSGAEFLEKNHPFSSDLDLFGSHSLFQLINHTGSQLGKKLLADLMKSPFQVQEAVQRGEAVSELSAKPLFLEAMESASKAFAFDSKEPSSWKSWLLKPERNSWIFSVLAILGPVFGIGILISVVQGWAPVGILGLWVLVGIVPLSFVFNSLKVAGESIPVASHLKSWLIRAQLIEQENFVSPLLKLEQQDVQQGEFTASAQLQTLDQLGLWVQNRMNLLYVPLNLILWTDFWLFTRLASWKKKVGNQLSHLPGKLENWEVWVSLGAFEYELEGKGAVTFKSEPGLSCKGLWHPLILPEKAVANSIEFDAAQQIVLLTGSNMSGKTTFMRTLGINCVLANLGLRPFAESLVMGGFQLFTSMRNSDNLGESVSSFYAELSRIRSLITRLEQGEQIFFLLDEILKGTNTQDRIDGSRALVTQILETRGFGIISTHDVELAEMERTGEKVHNYSFQSEIFDDQIKFDYTLKKGPCLSFNAHKLMELMGIRFTEK